MADTTRTPSGSPFRGPSDPVPSAEPQGEHAAAPALADAGKLGTELIAAVREGVASLFAEQRNRAADEIAAFGEVLRRSVPSLNQAGGGTVARYTDEAARRIDDFADRLRQRSWRELTGDIEDFARRWPGPFMASVAGLGFAAGRLLSSPAARPAEPNPMRSSPARAAGEGDAPSDGARHDDRAGSGAVSSGATSGHDAAAARDDE